MSNDHPYSLLWYKLVSETMLLANQIGILEAVDFIFDEQQGLKREIDRIWDMIILHVGGTMPWKRIVGSRPVFHDERDVVPLQAADMLAWLDRRSLHNEWSLEQVPLAVLENLEGIRPLHIKVTRDWMDRWYEKQMNDAARELARRPSAPLKFYDPSKTKRQRKLERQKGKRGDTSS